MIIALLAVIALGVVFIAMQTRREGTPAIRPRFLWVLAAVVIVGHSPGGSTPMKPYRGPPATLGGTAAAQARIIVWCRDCRHQAEPDPAELARRYGADIAIPDWHKRLVCSKCGNRAADFVLIGARR
jgi:hypothetical protein